MNQIEISCLSCGNRLLITRQSGAGDYAEHIKVAPCNTCLRDARDEAYNNGYNAALEWRKRNDSKG